MQFKRALVSVIVIMLFSGNIAATSTKPIPKVINCPEGSAETCDILDSKAISHLKGYTLDYAIPRAERIYFSYRGGANRTTYISTLRKENYGGEIPSRITMPLWDNVGIPQLGFVNQKGNIEIYSPVDATPTEVKTAHKAYGTSLLGPTRYHYTEMVGSRYTTYWWADTEELILVYYWELQQEGDTLVIDLLSVTIEWYPKSPSHKGVKTLEDTSKVVTPESVHLQKGEALEVVNLFEKAKYWSSHPISNWTLEYDLLAYVEFKREDSNTFIVSMEDLDITNGCGRYYRPYIGETLYVAEVRSWPNVTPQYPARFLRQDELDEFESRAATEDVKTLYGEIVSERGGEQDYFFTLQKVNGDQTELRHWEWAVPPVGKDVVIYISDDRIIGIRETVTNLWWFVEVPNALWDQCEE